MTTSTTLDPHVLRRHFYGSASTKSYICVQVVAKEACVTLQHVQMLQWHHFVRVYILLCVEVHVEPWFKHCATTAGRKAKHVCITQKPPRPASKSQRRLASKSLPTGFHQKACQGLHHEATECLQLKNLHQKQQAKYSSRKRAIKRLYLAISSLQKKATNACKKRQCFQSLI